MTSSGSRDDQSSPPRARSFNFAFSLGRKPPVADATFHEPSDEAGLKAGGAPATASLELKDGILRVGKTLEVDLNPREDPVDYADPFPALTTLRKWFHRLVVLVAICVPLSFIVLAIATEQTAETTFYLAFFGLLLSMMLVSSLFPPRTWLTNVTEAILLDAARKRTEQAPPVALEEQRVSAIEPRPFTIKCASCGELFAPTPPRAICPHCSTAALQE